MIYFIDCESCEFKTDDTVRGRAIATARTHVIHRQDHTTVVRAYASQATSRVRHKYEDRMEEEIARITRENIWG